MAFKNGEGLDIGGGRCEARTIVPAGELDGRSSRPSASQAQVPLRAGDASSTLGNVIARGIVTDLLGQAIELTRPYSIVRCRPSLALGFSGPPLWPRGIWDRVTL